MAGQGVGRSLLDSPTQQVHVGQTGREVAAPDAFTAVLLDGDLDRAIAGSDGSDQFGAAQPGDDLDPGRRPGA